jgi:hypothetical protein
MGVPVRGGLRHILPRQLARHDGVVVVLDAPPPEQRVKEARNITRLKWAQR